MVRIIFPESAIISMIIFILSLKVGLDHEREDPGPMTIMLGNSLIVLAKVLAQTIPVSLDRNYLLHLHLNVLYPVAGCLCVT